MKSTAHIYGPWMQLRDVVEVQPGYPSRGRIERADNGTHFLIQGKDVSDIDGVNLETAVRFRPERRPELYLVSRGDILITARGQDHRAYYVRQDVSDVLAAASFYILRCDPGRLLSAYLHWWLNLSHVQSIIDSASGGTYISYIRRQALQNLPITVPTLEVQYKIERVVSLCRKRSDLRTKIDEKLNTYIQALCLRAIQQSTDEESDQ